MTSQNVVSVKAFGFSQVIQYVNMKEVPMAGRNKIEASSASLGFEVNHSEVRT